MSNTIITIARSYGSGGRTIGQKLAKDLNIPYYDRELIYMASNRSGIDIRLFSENDESVKKNKLTLGDKFGIGKIPPESGRFASREDIFKCQAMLIKELAQKSDCIIIGRCANFILRNSHEKILRIFIWAPHEICVKNIMKKFEISESEADKMIRQINKHRKEYYQYYTKHEWEDIKNYDLCIDTSKFDEEQAVKFIKNNINFYRSY